MELDDLIEYLEAGNIVNGAFTLSYNDNGNLELTIVIPVDDTGEETTEEDNEALVFTHEIPAAMLKMAKMMGGF